MDCYAKMGDIDQLLSFFNNIKEDKTIKKMAKTIDNIIFVD